MMTSGNRLTDKSRPHQMERTPFSTVPPRGAFRSDGGATRFRQITESSMFPQFIHRAPNFPTRVSSCFTSYSDSTIMNPPQRGHFIDAPFLYAVRYALDRSAVYEDLLFRLFMHGTYHRRWHRNGLTKLLRLRRLRAKRTGKGTGLDSRCHEFSRWKLRSIVIFRGEVSAIQRIRLENSTCRQAS